RTRRSTYSAPMRVCVLAALAACTSSAPPPHPSDKPAAPVAVSIADRDLGAGDHEITLTATPTVDVAGITLTLADHYVAIGATARGETRTITTRVHLAPGEGRDVVGGAALGAPGHVRNRAAVVHIGTVAQVAPRATTTFRLPDGTVVEEVRR